MQKLDKKLDLIQNQLEKVDLKLDKIISLLTSNYVYGEYNHYFKEPILRTVASYQEFIAGEPNEYTQEALLFSCYDDNPTHALAWLNRTFHNSDDPSGLRLLDYIFDTQDKNCDDSNTWQERVDAWSDSIFHHASLAATMDQVCFATFAQKKISKEEKKSKMKQVLNNPPYAFEARAGRTSKSILGFLLRYLFE